MRPATRIGATILVVLALSCAGSPPPTPAAAAFDAPSTTSAIDEAALLDETAARDELRTVLEDAGFTGGVARTWTAGRDADVQGVEVRTLRFSDPDGAAAYLSWATEHAADLIGEASPAPGAAGYAVFTHEPGGCCPNKDTTSAVAVWRSDDVVWIATARGPGVTAATVTAVADAVSTSGGSD
jgi:hypothetical protein